MANNKDPITAEDIASFRDKIGTWGRSLPPQESAILNVVLDRAGEASGELTAEALEAVTGGAPLDGALDPVAARGGKRPWIRITVPWAKVTPHPDPEPPRW